MEPLMTLSQQRLFDRLTEAQQVEYLVYRDLGLSIDAAINVASQKSTGFANPTGARS